MRLYGFYRVFMGPNVSLLVLMRPDWSVCVFLGVYEF